MKIQKATLSDFDEIVKLIDDEFTKEGFGFVNRQQIKTEIRKGRVLVAKLLNEICGVRIGIMTMWNLVVSKKYRGNGIGKALVNYRRPTTIRVKSDPVGHLSKNQKKEFVDPTDFYEKLGFIFFDRAYPKNFWAGDTKSGTRIYISKGKIPHIKIYKERGSVFDFRKEAKDANTSNG